MRDEEPDPIIIEEHESPVRSMLHQATGDHFAPLRSLEEAKSHTDGVVILEGDWGGQIYVVVKAADVRCSEETLRHLLQDLDRNEWACNEGEGTAVYFERKSAGEGVAGGMGGAIVENGVWIHSSLEQVGFRAAIEAVLKGERTRLA